MSMTRWRPFSELMSMRDIMDRFFEENYMPQMMETEKMLPMNVYQTEDEIAVDTPIPGIKPEDIDISIVGETLTIRAERKEEKEVKEGDYLRKEMHVGRFCREMTLPVPVQADKASATFDNGVLHLTLPKAEETKPKKIEVKPKQELTGGSRPS